nr:MAG TPA: hypothetical protein [Caudoviricetes sp.]
MVFAHNKKKYMKHMNIPSFKYWLRIHGYRLERFGTGTKSNPIKVKSKRK